MKKILLIGLGGTIACSTTKDGLKPKYSPDYLLEKEPKIIKMAKVDSIQLMKRTIVYPKDWVQIASLIHRSLDQYDGFVITMGTDTLSYTSSMLSFMLKGINKPVAITGAMIPIENKNTDAKRNLKDSVLFACSRYKGIYVVFNGKVIIGCRASKVECNSISAFESINAPNFAQIENERIIKNKSTIKSQVRGYKFDININTNVISVKLNPQISVGFFSKTIEWRKVTS